MNGLRPTNVPERSLRLGSDYRVAATLPVLLQARVTYEGERMVLPDNSVRIPGWTRVDALARIEQHTSAGLVTWRVGVDNLFDRRAWKESPYQFGHVYLYPLQERALRVSAQIDL